MHFVRIMVKNDNYKDVYNSRQLLDTSGYDVLLCVQCLHSGCLPGVL